LHKHKESDIRKRNELQNEAAKVWDEPRFKMASRFHRLCNFIGASARFFFTLDFLLITAVFISEISEECGRGQFTDVKTCISNDPGKNTPE